VVHARKNEIQLLLRLEAKLEWHNERTRHPGEYETFREGMCDLSTIHDMCLAYGFQSINTLCVPLADLHNLAKAALANNGSQFKIIDGEWVTLKNSYCKDDKTKGTTHAARLERNANENFTTTAVEIIPLILGGHVIEVWGKLDTSEKNVIAHIVIRASFGLLLAQV
jgi:hypothetical protein